MWHLTKILCGSAVLAVAAIPAAVAGSPADAAEQQTAEGERLYAMYCAACHGEKATGDGPTAVVLKTRPADLTRLSATNGKTFPTARIAAAIDGRGIEHGTREMPLWGLAFQDWGSDTNQEREVQARIDALVRWIESIQR